MNHCDACAFEYDELHRAVLASTVRSYAELVARRLREHTAADLRRRPAPDTWSALECAGHVRDVLVVQHERVHQACSADRPEVTPMGRDERVRDGRYNDLEPLALADQIDAAAAALAQTLQGLAPDQWTRTLVYPWPTTAERSIDWLARHTVHECRHHLRDVDAALGRPAWTIGRRVPRFEDDALLRGRGRFVANLATADTWRATFVRATIAHGRLVSVDLAAARAHPGVVGVFAAADLDLAPIAPYAVVPAGYGRPPLARDAVRFVGEPIAIVVATTLAAAVDAAELVEVTYEPLPVTVDPRLARDAAPFIEGLPNLARVIDSDPPIDFSACEVVAEVETLNPRIYAAPMEPRVAMATWDGERLHCHSATQGVHMALGKFTGSLPLDDSQIRVVTPDVGGAFGAKSVPTAEEIALAAAAHRLGGSILWAETRSESMLAFGHCRDHRQRLTIGGTRDGDITHYRLDFVVDLGAFPDVNSLLPTFTRSMAQGVYRIPNVEVRCQAVMTNTTPIGSFRGAGRPEATAAIERAVDAFAAAIGRDPADVRARNLLQRDDFPFTTVPGARYDSGDYPTALAAVLDAVGYAELRAEQARRRAAQARRVLGIGIATYVEVTAQGGAGTGVPEHATVTLEHDGSLTLRVGSTAAGQGHVTTWRALVGDHLGVPLTDIAVVSADTDEIARSGVTAGSRSVQIVGAAAQSAGHQLVERARTVAADLLEAAVADVVFEPARAAFSVVGTPARALHWTDIATASPQPLVGESTYQHAAPTFPFGAHAAVVEVDPDTGAVELSRIVVVDDAGVLINPLLAEGQIQGGVAMGIANALSEGLVIDTDGNVRNANFAEYGILSAAELPSYELVVMETPAPFNPLGAKGVGESGTVGATPAVQSAVVDALAHLGVRHLDMPLTPQRVWQAIAAAER